MTSISTANFGYGHFSVNPRKSSQLSDFSTEEVFDNQQSLLQANKKNLSKESSFIEKNWVPLTIGATIAVGAVTAWATHGKVWGVKKPLQEIAGEASSIVNKGKQTFVNASSTITKSLDQMDVKELQAFAQGKTGKALTEVEEVLFFKQYEVALTPNTSLTKDQADQLLKQGRKLVSGQGGNALDVYKKEDILWHMSNIQKNQENYNEAINLLDEALKITGDTNPNIIGDIAKLHAKKDTPWEGINRAKTELEDLKIQIFGDDQAELIKGISDCLEVAKNKDLAKACKLLIQGSYHNNLTQADLEFLTKTMKITDVGKLTGNGSREQTGAVAKWVLKELEKLPPH